MRILHLCDQNWVGMANAFVEAHRRHGHESRLVTLVECVNEYEEDICLHLPLLQGTSFHMTLKKMMSGLHGNRPKFTQRPDGVPEWSPRSGLEAAFFRFRENVLWKSRIERTIREHGLDDYDVYHLESGVEFYRDGRFLKNVKARGARVVCYYLGTDLRDRGVIPAVRDLSDWNLTCEWDHLAMDPDLEYFFIPFDAARYEYREPATDRLRICHAPRNRHVKGTEILEAAVEEVRRDFDVELDLIEGVTHAEAIGRKRNANLLVDQVGANTSATGYGMNSLEALAMGIPSMTTMTEDYRRFLEPHPFVVIDPSRLAEQLRDLAKDPSALVARAREGREWVERVHGADAIVEKIYDRYAERGWMDEFGNAVRGGAR
ncbi:MAG: glycosyltransferase [Gemmatimonadetes bacterium]|nr:glycosyltransferase [Gemmatimonadota bacterium]